MPPGPVACRNIANKFASGLARHVPYGGYYGPFDSNLDATFVKVGTWGGMEVSKHGVGFRSTGSEYCYWYQSKPIPPITVLSVISINSVGPNRAWWSFATTPQDGLPLLLLKAHNNDLQLFYSSNYRITQSNFVYPGNLYAAAVSLNASGSAVLCVNGSIVGRSLVSVTPSDNNGYVGIGYNFTVDGVHHTYAAWHRTMRDDELVALTSSPSALYGDRRILMPLEAGIAGGMPTLTSLGITNVSGSGATVTVN